MGGYGGVGVFNQFGSLNSKPDRAFVLCSNGGASIKRPLITVLTIFVGRGFVLELWLKSLKNLNFPRGQVSILWVYSGKKEDAFASKLRLEFEKLKGYYSKTLVINPSLKKYFGSDGHIRHRIICDAYNYSKRYLGASDYVFLLEDDVIVRRDSLVKLLCLMKNRRIGFAVGFLRYRPNDSNHSTPLAWEFSQDGHRACVNFMPVQQDGIEEIGSGTFGCSLVREPLWSQTELVPWSEYIFGTDVNFGHQIRQKGYKSMIDWSVRCKHYFRTKEGKLVYV